MVDSDAVRIEKAIRKVQESGDESDLIEILLQDALNWPLADEDDENIEIDDISYSWDDVLEEMGFNSADAPVELRQVMPFPNWPHGIFIVRFGSNKFFTQGRGMTTPLRTILRELMEKVRPTADHPSWKKDHLLFLCHSETEYFQFARFEDQKGDSKTSKLQMFGWGPNDHIRTVCEYNLKNLIYKHGMNEEEATEAVASAFDVSKVSERFYEDYKKAFETAKPIIEKNSSLTDANEIHQTTQTLFNRILFLRFIEKKGWLHFGETDDYLRELFKAGGVGSNTFYSSRLKRLFFEGLAIEGKQNNSAYGDVAFLNGGLFEETKFDKSISDLPNEMFEPLLGENGLFYNYNFTVQESTPLDINVAIDPEMIGTMFEELVTGRNEKGAFYTPRVVVAYMCREAIKSVLEEKTDVDLEAIRKLVDDNDNEGLSIDDARAINSVLAEVKVIDPACGSGAYLLGLLHELVRVHTKLSTTAEDLTESRHKMKLRIISRSIYGVDLDPFATNIAMLRLWLSLSVEAPEPLPLPNLDFNIETGDSLLAPDPSAYVFDVTGAIERADALALKKEAYLEATGDVARELRAEIKEEEGEIRKLLRKQNDEIGSVDFRVHFASVFTKNGGFDVVLANPPYVRQEEIEKKSKSKMLALYGVGDNPPVQGKSDLYCYFFVRANQLLRTGGIQIFICSNTWLDVGFGMPLQHLFLRTSQIDRILDSAVERQFQSADVNTAISFIRKKSASETHEVNFTFLQGPFDSASRTTEQQKIRMVGQSELRNSGTNRRGKYEGTKWSNHLRAPDIYWRIVEELTEDLVKLKDVADVKFGTKTGCNEFFYLSEEKIAEWGLEKRFIVPIMKSSQQSKRTHPLLSEFGLSLFYCKSSKQSLQGTNALRYIEWGEESHIVADKNGKPKEMRKFHERATTKSRKDWYFVGERTPPPLIGPKSMNEMYKSFRNQENVFIGDRLYEVYPVKGFEDEINALMQSTYFSFMLELGARTGLGQGLLDLMVYELENVLIPDPGIIEGIKPLNRKYMKIEDELISQDRLELDKVIFESIGLNNLEIEDFYSSYRQIVSNRLGKAISITSPIN